MSAQTIQGTPTVTAEQIGQLAANLRGDLILPSDPDYESVRAVYNGMIDKRPAMIARCADVADVIAAVTFARKHDLLLAIRGGGHHGAGLGTCDAGLVIDLSQMKGIRVDPESRSVRVEGGCTWGEVDHATHAFGMATPSGFISTTGVGGLTLGGGLGYLTRKYGLTIDNLLAVDIVLADGSFVTANADQHADLFWAVRGGGGNFGVVTSFLFRLHPVSTVVGGPTLWPIDQAAEVMRWYRDFITEAPEDLNGWFGILVVPPAPTFPEDLHLKTMCGIVWCYTGPEERADEVFAPVQEVGAPALHGVGAMPYPVLQSAFDGLFTPGLQWYWKADFVDELSDEAIERHLEFAAEIPTMLSTMHLYPINGAAHRVGKDDTAWGYRDATWGMVIAGVDPDPANAEKISTWARDYWQAIHPYSAGGAYVNMMMEEGPDRIRAAYRDNYERLVEVKTRYDPSNLFCVNLNIKPLS
ncbi:MAG: FAD-binding oxidoreductase [Chloroflexia bacterium]|nr:FAD-binding oxidoreductase [Chloroflexia bacterium]